MKLTKQEERAGLAAAAVIVVVLAAWFMVFWRPEGASLRAAQKAESQAAAQVASDEAQIAALRADAPKVSKEKAVLRKLVEEVPDGPSLDQMLVTIDSAASAAGVKVTSVGTPQPAGWAATSASSSAPTTASGPQYISLSLEVTGTQARLLKFVSALDAEPRLYVVNDFSLGSPSGAGGTSSTSLTVQGFFESASSNNPTFPGN